MSSKLFAFTTLLALTAAIPSGVRTTLSERRAAQTECWQTKPGTTFYRCSNGYVGCFSKEPCSLPPIASTTTTTTTTPTSTPSSAPQRIEITKPRSYNIYPLTRINETDKVGHVDLNKPKDSEVTTTNAMIFENLPAGAKNCQLKWRSTAPDGDNIFTVEGNGQAWTRQLLGFPSGSEKVSFDGLKKYQDPNAQWSPSLDFTGWTSTPGDHNGPALKCGQQVAVEIKGSDEGTETNRVFITLTETNGFYLTYEL